MDLGLRDRVAIVRGSSQGIGKDVAFGLANEGADVTICARNQEKLLETAREITAATGVMSSPFRSILANGMTLRRW
jgi:3-oxoacyl-[acyl-carrier protein] reductase